MSDISKEELKKEIAAILKDADLGTITSKKVRQDIEKKLDTDLSDRKKEVDELVMEHLDKLEKENKKQKNGKASEEEDDEEEDDNEEDDDDEEEEEEKKPKRSSTSKKPPAKKYKSGSASSDESEDASDGGDDEYSPKKKTAKKPAGKRGSKKKKGGSDDDSDEDWGKNKKKKAAGAKAGGGAKRSSGYTKPVNLSPELAAIVGENQMPRHEVVKRIWAIIKERNLYDPKNKQFAICDDELFKVIGVKRFRTFGMMKFLKTHFRD